jgi:hypothetical protein
MGRKAFLLQPIQVRTNGVARMNEVMEHRAAKALAGEKWLKTTEHTPAVTFCANSAPPHAQRYDCVTGRAVFLETFIVTR